jgi:hypothetical protein
MMLHNQRNNEVAVVDDVLRKVFRYLTRAFSSRTLPAKIREEILALSGNRMFTDGIRRPNLCIRIGWKRL